MRYLKLFFSTLLVFTIILSLISWLMPSKIMLARSVTIAAERSFIRGQFGDLKNWPNWNPYFREMPAKNIYIPNSSQLIWKEKGENMTMFISDSSEFHLSFILRSADQNSMINTLTILPIKGSPAWQVEWRVVSPLPWYPWERFAAIFFDKTAGPSYEAALASLKEYCEQQN